MQNNTPEERLTYQLCIDIINKIAQTYGELNVPGILDPLIAKRIDLAIQDVLTKLEGLDGKTDIKLEDINKIKAECQKIIANGNKLSANFVEALTLLESITDHVNDVESNIELKAQQIQTIKEAIGILEQTINSLVDRAALIEKNIDVLYREVVEDFNLIQQMHAEIDQWYEQLMSVNDKIIELTRLNEESKILIPQAQEINEELKEHIDQGLVLDEVINNAVNTVETAGQEQVDSINTLADTKSQDFKNLADEKLADFSIVGYPVKSTYTQYPNDTTGLFTETETPLALFGGDWELLDTKLFNNVPTKHTNEFGYSLKWSDGRLEFNCIPSGFPDRSVGFPVPFIEIPTMITNMVRRTNGDTVVNDNDVRYTVGAFYISKRAYLSVVAGSPTMNCVARATGYWKNPTDPITPEEEKNYVKIWKRI